MDETGGACDTYWRENRYKKGFGVGNLRERVNFEDMGGDGRIIIKLSQRKMTRAQTD
jgi:hypothetical protein